MPSLGDFAFAVINTVPFDVNSDDVEAYCKVVDEWDAKYQLAPKVDSESFENLEAYTNINEHYATILLAGENHTYSEDLFYNEMSLREVGYIAAAWATIHNHLLNTLPERLAVDASKKALDEAQNTGQTSLEPDETESLAKVLKDLGYKIVKD